MGKGGGELLKKYGVEESGSLSLCTSRGTESPIQHYSQTQLHSIAAVNIESAHYD